MPVIEQLNYSGAQMAALSICIAGGSIVVSHVNDAGFWLFGKFTGATEAETLKTWTMMETILGTVGAIVGMIAFQLLSSVCSPGSCDATGFFSKNSPRYPFIHIRMPSRNIWVAIITRINPIRRSSAFTPFSPSRRKNSEDCSRMTKVPPQASSRAITRCPI